MTDNSTNIDRMATALTAISTASNDQTGTNDAAREDVSSEPSAQTDGSVSIDKEGSRRKVGELAFADVNNAAFTKLVAGQGAITESSLQTSVADNHGDAGETPDLIDIPAKMSGSASEPLAAPAAVVPPLVGTNIFDGFPAAPVQPGEFTLLLCDLLVGIASEGGVYDFDSGAGESLLHAVQIPENIAPIVVMKVNDDWHVLDGWARVKAMQYQFGNSANVLVRVIEWDGTRNAALYDRFAAAFLTLKSRKIDKAILLLQFHRAWSVPQMVLAARIGWTDSRVTRELGAAKAMLEAPRFAELHVKAGDPPIDYLYKIQQARDAAAADDEAHPKRAPEKGAIAKLASRLEGLLAKPDRFATAEALAKLGIAKSDKTRATTQTSEPAEMPAVPSAPELIDCVEDSSGDAIVMLEIGADQLRGMRMLVDVTTLDDRRAAEVRHLAHEALDRLLGF